MKAIIQLELDGIESLAKEAALRIAADSEALTLIEEKPVTSGSLKVPCLQDVISFYVIMCSTYIVLYVFKGFCIWSLRIPSTICQETRRSTKRRQLSYAQPERKRIKR